MSTRVRPPRRRYSTPIHSKLAAQRVTGFTPLSSSPHVTAFPLPLESLKDSKDLRKSPDLLEYAGRQPWHRDILADPDQRLRKLCIETGTDPRTGRFRRTPLEPWTGPSGSALMYASLMRDADGAHRVGEFGPDGLSALEWMRDEELISIGTAGEIHALSDAKAGQCRKYPGAPVPDKRAGTGKQLRDKLGELIRLALLNLSLGRTVRRIRRRRSGLLQRSDGIAITAARVAEEANAIKARRPDLAGYRWASLSRVREVIRDLISLGAVEEISPPKPVRQRRSWRTLPRVIRRLAGDEAENAREKAREKEKAK